MARVKSIAARKHRKFLKAAKGFKQSRSSRIKIVKESLLHAGQYAYEGRRLRKRDLRGLWITRLNAALREKGLSYSRFISLLSKKGVVLDRKILSDIAVTDPETFNKIVSEVK